ncbi:sensor histidine kinase [Asanoa hainanensis]|uniref:sensor histidine kinase n=1 Tax=Asanoa hainanensis TaxID=560556 RepID=UPI000B76C709|nr:sensor histidine kinase [Asanoa hainanensis]
MSPSRPVPWVSTALYGAVLVGGLYAWIAGIGATQPIVFVAALGALFALDLAELRRYPVRTPAGPAATLLAVRLALILAVTAADGSGLARALFVLLPFTAYFAYGRAVSIAVALGCVALVVVTFHLTIPHWYAEAEPVSDLLMFSVGLVLTIAMASVAVAEQRGRARVADLSAAAERNRVARDIHDGLGHHLTAITLLLEKAETFRDLDPPAADRAVQEARQSARRALQDVRESVRALRPGGPPFHLSTALTDLAGQVDDGRTAVRVDVTGDERRYDTEALIALYRAAQEGITNSRRHAGANLISVNVALGAASARLVVADDGCGFPASREGFGLTGMRERVQLAGGSVAISSGPGAGTTLTVTVPSRTPR